MFKSQLLLKQKLHILILQLYYAQKSLTVFIHVLLGIIHTCTVYYILVSIYSSLICPQDYELFLSNINLLLLISCKPLDDGCNFAAIVGAKRSGSLQLSDTFLPTTSMSSILACNILVMMNGMYWYPLFTFVIFPSHPIVSHCCVRWLYRLHIICSPDLFFAYGRFKWKFQSIVASYFPAL